MSSYNDPPSSPLNNSIPELRPETPALEHLLEYATQNALLRCNKLLPARILKVVSDQVVDIQLLPKTLYATDTDSTVKPVLPDIPVAMSMGADWSIRLPIAVGDLGYALIADRSTDNYFDGDGSKPYSPADTRLHDLSDAIFVPGLCTNSGQTTFGTDNTDMVLTNGKSQLALQKGGTFRVSNGSQELFDLLDQLLTLLASQFIVIGSLGTSQPIASTVQAIAELQSKLDTLKGGQ